MSVLSSSGFSVKVTCGFLTVETMENCGNYTGLSDNGFKDNIANQVLFKSRVSYDDVLF